MLDMIAGRKWFDRKSELIEERLGPEQEMSRQAIVPYEVGGPLALYFYSHALPGTGMATKELSLLPGHGSSNQIFQNYELVMFTRHAFDFATIEDIETPVRRQFERMYSILNAIARYSAGASLNPGETCEFPRDQPRVGGQCLVFDAYPPHAASDEDSLEFGLLLVIELFRTEMDFARVHGAERLFKRLKSKGYYPYSDLDRKPVA